MKNIFLIALILVVVSCKNEQPPRNYAVIHGKITNPIDSINLRLFNPESRKNIMIAVDAEGNFRDTLKLEEPSNLNAVYKNVFGIHLANDMDIQLSFDTKNFTESLTFSGKGEVENNFLRHKSKQTNALYGEDFKAFFSLDEADFQAKTKSYIADLESELESKKALLDSSFINTQKEELKVFQDQNLAQYQEQQKINKALAKGNPSPEFNDYMNYAGGTSSLKDYIGSYVYIDVWATWCGPCKAEIPFLKEVEKKYHGKNIEFVSMSVDKAEDHDKWKAMIAEEELGGIQIFADKSWDSDFVQDYLIKGIPRFILIDPQGNIVSSNAPRPSNPKLIEMFDENNI